MLISILKDNRPVDSIRLDTKTKSVFLIGRSDSNDIILHDPVVPGQHAQLFFDNTHWCIRKTSRDGVLTLNNKVIGTDSVLQAGDVIFVEPSYVLTFIF